MTTPSFHEREQAIRDTLFAVHDNGTPIEYDTNPLTNLIIVTDSVVSLCWNIETATKLPASPTPTSPCAQDIIEEATKIAGLCLAELNNMYEGVERAGVTLASAQAAQNIRGPYTLDRLDLDVDPTSRIELLIKALGDAAPYWSYRNLSNKMDRTYRTETIANLAYHVVCATIATKRQLIAG